MLFGYFFFKSNIRVPCCLLFLYCFLTALWFLGYLWFCSDSRCRCASQAHLVTGYGSSFTCTRVKLQPQLWGWHGVMGMITKTGFSSSCCPVNRRGDVYLFAVFAVNSCVRISPGTLATVFSIWLFKSKKTESHRWNICFFNACLTVTS